MSEPIGFYAQQDTIATLQAQVAQLRAALEEIAGCRGNFGSGIKLKERARAALDALAREALKEKP